MEKYKTIRDTLYDVQLTRWKHLINIKSPYTFLKGIYYMETASLFLFLTQNIIKSPNFITMLYIFTGVSGAFFLNSSQEVFFFLGVFMVFTKGTFDWADGPLARRLNKTSFLGSALDMYGAEVCDAAFRVSFIFIAFSYYEKLFNFLPLVLFIILITKFKLYSGYLYFKEISKNILDESENRNEKIVKDIRYTPKIRSISNFYYNYISFLDARARSIDFLLLMLILNKIYNNNLSIILLILSLLIVLRSIVMNFASIYFSLKVYGKENNNRV